jgi:hypothetical protein
MPAFMDGCASCTYYSRNPNPKNPSTGQCRRASPKADPVPNAEGRMSIRTYWPVVHDDWWCGQHKEKS